MTFPLYLSHVLFFFNLALRTKRTNPAQLYLWGVLFGMYESWITQVLWFGFSGTHTTMWGTILGIGIGEFIGLVLFWHPVLAFVLPLLMFQSLALSKNSEIPPSRRVLGSNIPLLSRSNLKYLYGLCALTATVTATNFRGDIGVVLAAFGVTYAMIYVLYRRANPQNFTVYSLRLGSKGMKMLIAYLIFLYSFGIVFLGIGRNLIPGPLTILSTLGIYAIMGWILHTSRPDPEPENVNPGLIQNAMNLQDYSKFSAFSLGSIILLSLAYTSTQGASAIIFIPAYLFLNLAGCYILYKALGKALKK